MRKEEIGGYFELEEYTGRDYYNGLYHLNLARTALVCLLEALECKKILLPYFLCDSVISAIKKTGSDIRFYHISNDFCPKDDITLQDGEYMLIVNYYGQISDEKLKFFRDKYKRVIVDNTHAYFQRPVKGIPTVYSCRKFFGLPDGAILSYDGKLKKIERDRSNMRMSHILGRFEDGASPHYSEMLDTAESFYDSAPLEMSRLTENLLKGIDYDAVRERRNANYKRLSEQLGKYNKAGFVSPDGPFCYPLWTDGGIAIRRELAKKKIYVPTYWNNVINEMPKDSVEYDMAANILALPCDQRCTFDDIDAEIAEVIKLL
ncbi:MAG TPA: hypothetical protein IAB17_04205 [Candidatus Alectryocaccobium stercorigallinarum]|jgi:hypothetical protein|nr:hypothetical protein [Candidatus Alectryocaccobium stercorigallinarum]